MLSRVRVERTWIRQEAKTIVAWIHEHGREEMRGTTKQVLHYVWSQSRRRTLVRCDSIITWIYLHILSHHGWEHVQGMDEWEANQEGYPISTRMIMKEDDENVFLMGRTKRKWNHWTWLWMRVVSSMKWQRSTSCMESMIIPSVSSPSWHTISCRHRMENLKYSISPMIDWDTFVSSIRITSMIS